VGRIVVHFTADLLRFDDAAKTEMPDEYYERLQK
jgi:hypothetical protein